MHDRQDSRAAGPREVRERAHRFVKVYGLAGFADMFAADGVW
ncbi:MAG TPA: hypothetical protein VF192_10650 [Longimicrobiales bacterium]